MVFIKLMLVLTNDAVRLLTRKTEPGLEEILRQRDKREDGSVVGETRQGQEPEGHREVFDVTELDNFPRLPDLLDGQQSVAAAVHPGQDERTEERHDAPKTSLIYNLID